MKLEIESVTVTDKGSYKLVAKNEKGEATSQTVEVTEIPEEEEVKKGNKPEFSQGLSSAVSTCSHVHMNECPSFFEYGIYFESHTYTQFKLQFGHDHISYAASTLM